MFSLWCKGVIIRYKHPGNSFKHHLIKRVNNIACWKRCFSLCVCVRAMPVNKDNLSPLSLGERVAYTKWSVSSIHQNVAVASVHCRLVLSTHEVHNTMFGVCKNMSNSQLEASTAVPITTSSCPNLWASGPQETDEIQIMGQKSKLHL